MNTYSIKKHFSFLILIRLFPLLLFLFTILFLCIYAVNQANAVTIQRSNERYALVGPQTPPGSLQQNNQSFKGVSNSGNNGTFIGANEANSGNQGINRGLSQDNSINSGNAVSGQRKNIVYQQNNQLYKNEGDSSGGNTANFVGANQGNSGNEGYNAGNNQDNSSNAGNQVNNQGDVIGTQINNQGSQVNNNGSVIEHQINYLNIIPALRVNLTLKPKAQVSLGLGGN